MYCDQVVCGVHERSKEIKNRGGHVCIFLLCLLCVCVYVVIVVRLTTFAMPNFEYYMIEQVGKKK